jgi:predicted HTH transcriptional regulator
VPLDPQTVARNFADYLNRFTASSDAEVEDQLFDRKDVPLPPPNSNVSTSILRELKEAIRETVSAFANANPEGGLLVLGISKTGEVRGINHLTDAQRNDLSNIGQLLRNQGASVRMEECQDSRGNPNRLLLILVPPTPDAICETTEAMPRAWKRAGAQNLPLTDRDRDQLRRDKRIDPFERRPAGRFDISYVDHGLLREIRATWPELGAFDRDDTELLHELGAIEQTSQGGMFTSAGLLFFAANPQRELPSAHIRMLRYEANHDDGNPGDPTLDKTFSGSITRQLLAVRDFLRDSGLIRVYHVRNPEGGFAEEPELPFIAVDEAIVNAVAHREYGAEWPVECVFYRDALVVKNPGRIIQRSGRVPPVFRLDERTLQSTPRNPTLLQWLRQSRDQKGQQFVRALSEGTRTMLRAMTEARLPSPEYRVDEAETILTLRIDASRRVKPPAQTSEFANLYLLSTSGRLPDDGRRALLGTLRDRLKAEGWFIDRFAHGRILAHKAGNELSVPQAVRRVVRLFPASVFAIREFRSRLYLALDYQVEVKSVLTLADLQQRGREPDLFIRRWATVKTRAGWTEAKIETVSSSDARVSIPDLEQTESVPFDRVIPNLGLSEIKTEIADTNFDLSVEIKRRSLASEYGAARKRAERTQLTVEGLAQQVFPLRVHDVTVSLTTEAVRLDEISGLPARTLAEPRVEFGRHRESSNIREGITEFGAYSHEESAIELVPVVAEAQRGQMQALIERLKSGKYKYKGSERTFGVRFTYASIVGLHAREDVTATCRRVLSEHPEWAGDSRLRRLFLVHTPEATFALDDERSPYYTAKRLLLEAGVPCQMVDTPTLENPDWKDLNLALNVAAKCGVVPWVLPEGIPDADFFVGLSYTQHRGDPDERLMGYANVFNRYGRWLFYSGNVTTFPFSERRLRLAELVEDTLRRVDALSETAHIYFHYSARFSRDDRDALTVAARKVRPHGVYSFVWINSHHPIRLYDARPESDGSLGRGTYVVTSENQLYLSTTGYNPYRKMLGTPLPLELTVWTDPPSGKKSTPPDLHALARQILALTKLNWSSSDALTGEPITTKYAGDIAYLTAAFLRQRDSFRLHAALERTPWFL